MKSILSAFSLVICAFGVISKKSLYGSVSKALLKEYAVVLAWGGRVRERGVRLWAAFEDLSLIRMNCHQLLGQ